MADDRMTKISKAKSRLLMSNPFFATLLLRTEVVIRDDLPHKTAATDGERMYFDPDFLDKLSIDDTIWVMCHEVGHDALLHSIRLGTRDHDVWNQACDHAINLMLATQDMNGRKMTPPKAVAGGVLADPKYTGMAADRIYDDLRRNPPPKPKQDWMHGDVMPNPAAATGDPAAQAMAETRAKQKVASAANMARMAGKMSADLSRIIDGVLETKVDWTEVLADKMTQVVKERDNWARRNRRFSKFYIPTRRSLKMGPIIFIPDTSGSMWDDDMEKITSEIAHCAAQTKPENIRVVWADTKVKGEQVFTADEFSFAALEPKGGGGTNMCVPLQYIEQYDPLVAVLMTDGETPWPELPPPYELIIVCTTDIACPDYAEVIRI